MSLTLGQTVILSGDVSTLQWIKPGFEADIERSLGYHPGRLARGYWIALLKQLPSPADFQFGGTTLRSGGREGLPAASEELDRLRPSVHKQMLLKYGADQYVEMQKAALRMITLIGHQRIAKVLPDIRHDPALAPNTQYPMGGGGLQWTINKTHGLSFLAAVRVEADGQAHTPDFSVNLRTDGYDSRAKLRGYMIEA